MKKKYSITLFIFLVSILLAKAQISVGLLSGYQLPIGKNIQDIFYSNTPQYADFRCFSKGNIPVGISIKYKLNDKVGIYTDYNYLVNINESIDINATTFNFSNKVHAIKVGANYLFGTGKLKPLLGVDVGIYIWTPKFYSTSNGTTHEVNFESNNSLGIGAKAGILYQVTDKLDILATDNFAYIFSSGTLTYKEAGLDPIPLSDSKMIGLQIGIDYHFGK